MNDWTFRYRVAGGIAVFAVLLAYELWKDPRGARRPKEYAFLFGLAIFAMAYGVAHDFVTWSISHDYFVHGKGIAAARDRFFPEVMQLGMMATWSVGLGGAALMLVANNPNKQGQQLPYATLLRLAVYPLLVSVGVETILGIAAAILGDRVVEWATGHVRANRTGFFTVWAMHIGAYLGFAMGLVAAIFLLRRRKSRMACMAASSPVD